MHVGVDLRVIIRVLEMLLLVKSCRLDELHACTGVGDFIRVLSNRVKVGDRLMNTTLNGPWQLFREHASSAISLDVSHFSFVY